MCPGLSELEEAGIITKEFALDSLEESPTSLTKKLLRCSRADTARDLRPSVPH